MGAEQFYDHYPCNPQKVSAEIAFWELVEQAQYDHGHAGYTGTIAEKHEFNFIMHVESKGFAETFADNLLRDGDERINDKWGPAGAISYPDGYLFFGYASS